MGLFGNLFGSTKDKENKSEIPWISLNQMEQLDEIIERSKQRSQLIFKHSTTCGVSRMVLNMFGDNYSLNEQADAYFLDLLAYRAISNEIERKFGVMHQSPQLLVIKNGEVTFHASHGAITEANLEEVI